MPCNGGVACRLAARLSEFPPAYVIRNTPHPLGARISGWKLDGTSRTQSLQLMIPPSHLSVLSKSCAFRCLFVFCCLVLLCCVVKLLVPIVPCHVYQGRCCYVAFTCKLRCFVISWYVLTVLTTEWRCHSYYILLLSLQLQCCCKWNAPYVCPGLDQEVCCLRYWHKKKVSIEAADVLRPPGFLVQIEAELEDLQIMSWFQLFSALQLFPKNIRLWKSFKLPKENSWLNISQPSKNVF